MTPQACLELLPMLHNSQMLCCYCGVMNEETLLSLGRSLQKTLRREQVDANTVKKSFSIVVEGIQNILRYASDAQSEAAEANEQEEAFPRGILLVWRGETQLHITCGNTVAQAEVASLRNRLEFLQTKDRDELRQLYRERLQSDPEPQSKGATLGLIEIARRASEPLNFHFENLSENSALFCLEVRV
jgi:hypothetical protein